MNGSDSMGLTGLEDGRNVKPGLEPEKPGGNGELNCSLKDSPLDNIRELVYGGKRNIENVVTGTLNRQPEAPAKWLPRLELEESLPTDSLPKPIQAFRSKLSADSMFDPAPLERFLNDYLDNNAGLSSEERESMRSIHRGLVRGTSGDICEAWAELSLEARSRTAALLQGLHGGKFGIDIQFRISNDGGLQIVSGSQGRRDYLAVSPSGVTATVEDPNMLEPQPTSLARVTRSMQSLMSDGLRPFMRVSR